MKRQGRQDGILARTAAALDLPGDAIAGLTRLELIGSGQLRMENHGGILSYGDSEIHVSGGDKIVKVVGQGLELRAMTGQELLITRQISAIDLE